MARVLGIDIGGTKLALAVGGPEGRLLARRRRPLAPSGDAERDLEGVVADARAVLGEAGLDAADLAAVGVSAPGPLDREAGLVLGPPNLPGWTRAPVVARLAAAFGRPVFLDNDANAGALAEWRFGAGAGRQHVVYLTMSTGVGGGMVLGGRLHRGVGDSAGEVGHAPVEVPGEPCVCGLSGCLEAYVGGAAWTRRLRARTPAESRVRALAGAPDAILPEHVVAAAREGDAFALAEMERFNEYVARAVVSLAFTVAPEVVVLGTIPTAAGEALCLAPIRERVRARTWPALRGIEIVPAALGGRVAELAGICVALDGLGL